MYTFAQMDSADITEAEGMREHTPPKKKKKKKHSQWLNHCRKTQFKDSSTSQVGHMHTSLIFLRKVRAYQSLGHLLFHAIGFFHE